MFLESSGVTQTFVCTDHHWQHCCLDSLRLLYLLIHLLVFLNLFLDMVTWNIFVYHHLLLLLLSHQNMDVYPFSLDLEILGDFSLFILLPLVESFWPWNHQSACIPCTLHLPASSTRMSFVALSQGHLCTICFCLCWSFAKHQCLHSYESCLLLSFVHNNPDPFLIKGKWCGINQIPSGPTHF